GASFALAAILALTACSRVGAPPAAGGHHAWTIPGVLRIGQPDEPDSLNPLFGNSAATDDAAALLFAPVLRYDDRGEFMPELATVVPSKRNGGISADGKTIVLHFRRGVTWADGAPLTARDLRFTYRVVTNDANNVKSRFGWDDIAAIDAPTDLTAIVHLKRPEADILGLFATGGAAYPPLPEHLLGKLPNLNRAAFNTQPLSSGPWMLKSWQHGAQLVFEPNRRYWRGPPKLKELIWKVIPSNDTLLAALSTHEIDVYPNVAGDQIDRLTTIAGITVAHRLLANWRRIAIDVARPPLDDVHVRRAIALGVDWDRLNRTIYHDRNRRAISDIFPGSWAAPAIAPYPFDPAAARRLLEAAGFRTGPGGIRRRAEKPLQLTISSTNLLSNEQAEVQIQQQLRAIGIDLAIKNYPASVLFAQTGPLYTGRYDLESSIDTNAPDPDNRGLWSAQFIPPNGGNTSFVRDPVLTRLADAAARTYDRATRKRLYQTEEERIHALVLDIPVYWEVGYAAYNSDLKNYRPAAYITNNWNSWEWTI
ncbi:MAG: ABC transporter substrate-binding protein, partial [Vulcanimicrobiaceae bacterium]